MDLSVLLKDLKTWIIEENISLKKEFNYL